MIINRTISIFILLTLLCIDGRSQDQRISPLDVTTARYKDTYLKIVYSQPQKKGRTIFGALVPYGQVWRTGANEATEITLTTPILIQGKELPAGTYSIFTIPEEKTWTIIINADLGLWGSYNYNPKRDILRMQSNVVDTEAITESFTIDIETNNNLAELIFRWDRTKISLPIQFPEPKPKP